MISHDEAVRSTFTDDLSNSTVVLNVAVPVKDFSEESVLFSLRLGHEWIDEWTEDESAEFLSSSKSPLFVGG